MKTLHLTLKKKWFDMVGPDKPEEYREINDWILPRLMVMRSPFVMEHSCTLYTKLKDAFWFSVGYKKTRSNAVDFLIEKGAEFREYDKVCFQWGYSTDAPRKTFRFNGTEIREGRPEWGAEPGKKYFVIKLGEKI